jgi:NAD(P)-dependent dehydrogenase (short-subunit alcohol dehydrogenase family)
VAKKRTTRTTAAGRGSRTGEQYREIQRTIDSRDKSKGAKGEGGSEKAVHAGDRKQPENPMPKQHLPKPGLEADLELQPRYLAPGYKGSEKLKDMVAIITGGDSGIGRAVAVLYAREGADVAIVYLPEEQPDAEETKRAVEREGRECLLIPGDVSRFEFCEDVVERTLQEFGRLDILVNNAAFQEHAESLEELTLEHFDRTMKTNLYGYVYMAKAALPHLKRGSSIINTGSVTGIRGSKELLDYSTTKGGIHAFTRSLSQNVLEKGIRVNAVAPGPVWTPLNPADKSAKDVAKFGSQTPMKRPAQPEELSPVYVFLAAPSCSSYITGEVIPVVGGQAGS